MLWALTFILNLNMMISEMKEATKVVPIAMTTGPRQGFEPLTIKGRITIPPHADNRAFCINWDSLEGQAGISCTPLNGAQDYKTHYYEIKRLPAGHYEFTGVLLRSQDRLFTPPAVVDITSIQ